MANKTAAVFTLGCRLNQADSALLANRLRRMGFDIVSVDAPSSPNLIIVNSCTVTGIAAKKSRQSLKSLRDENPQSFIVMTGCSADIDRDALDQLHECDLILSNEQKKDIERILPRHLAYLQNPGSAGNKEDAAPQNVFHELAEGEFPFKSRAILKVQEGCDNFCTYCIVPYARGRERSRDLEETVADFKHLVDAGFQEIVLSGVNICNYNCNGVDLVGLIGRLLEVPGTWRIRLSSTEPGPIVPELVKCIAAHPDKICAFLHLPIQNGSEEILQKMGRKYSAAGYVKMIADARAAVPGLHVGTDLIVGFPGETAENFKECCKTITSLDFANIHVFPYSPRKGTPAADMSGRVMGEELDRRLEEMKKIKTDSAAAFLKTLIGQEETVLVESKHPNGVCEGWSGNYVKTRFLAPDQDLRKLVRVRFKKILNDGAMVAEVIK